MYTTLNSGCFTEANIVAWDPQEFEGYSMYNEVSQEFPV